MWNKALKLFQNYFISHISTVQASALAIGGVYAYTANVSIAPYIVEKPMVFRRPGDLYDLSFSR